LSIRTWKVALALGLCALGVLIFLMLQLPNNQAGPPPTTAIYVPNDSCAQVGCHSNINATFNQTGHSFAYLNVIGGPDRCMPCHVVGAGRPSIYPATGFNVTTRLPTYLENVSCQVCHGPGSLHEESTYNEKLQTIGLVLNSTLCGSCHTEKVGGTHHPTYNEWNMSGHAEVGLPDYVKNNVQCANCHESWMAMKLIETGIYRTSYRVGIEDAPLTWEIGCPTCHDPHSIGANGFAQLRVDENEICQKCHNAYGATYAGEPDGKPHHPMAEMRNNTAGYGVDRSQTSYMSTISCFNCHMGVENAGLPNHTFAPNATACLVCHDSTGLEPDLTSVSEAQALIDSIAAKTDGQLTMGKPLLDDALAAIKQMAGNRTGEDLSAWMTQYRIALFNLDSVDLDMSQGNHNPGLADELLVDSMARSNSTVANLTPPDKITGIQVTVTDLADGQIRVSWTPSTASDFAKYRIYILSSSKTNVTDSSWRLQLDDKSTSSVTIDDLKASTYYVYVTAVDSNGNEITNTLSPVSIAVQSSEGLSTEAMGLIAAMIIVIVMASAIGVLLMRRRHVPNAPETKATEPEAPETPEKKE